MPIASGAGGGGAVNTNGGGAANTNGGGAATVCTPGVTGPVITDCGYPYNSSNPLTSVVFNESEVLRAIEPSGGGVATVRLFYNDEHALTLGVRRVVVIDSAGSTTKDYPVSPLVTNPDRVFFPQTGTTALAGDQSGLDPSQRPMWPVLYITDITSNPNSTAGDWQQGGTPYAPSAVYGTWKAALRTVDKTKTPEVVSTTPDADPAKNNWKLGSGADPVPATLTKDQGYGAEVIWNLSLAPGHSYRVQAIVHDGDQNKVGGDSGEACVNFCAGTDTCKPITCADYPAGNCGPQSDHCGGTIDCGPCMCLPQSCESACTPATGGYAECQTKYDESTGYVVNCAQRSSCEDPSTIQCWCVSG